VNDVPIEDVFLFIAGLMLLVGIIIIIGDRWFGPPPKK
jgi:hypothetical protein